MRNNTYSLESISICLPVYNHDMRELVEELSRQASQLSIPYQILMIDDESTSFKEKNRELLAIDSNITYEELPKNIGRSKIRNLLAEKAQYQWLLMMDCDCLIRHSDFLLKYKEACDHLVICGGTKFEEEEPNPDSILRWKYGKERDADNRNESFRSANFFILREIFQEVKFDETIVGYGHEDTMFGFALKKKGIKIKYIDNPTCHNDQVTTEVYLKRIENSLKNLLFIYHKLPIEDQKEFLKSNPALNVNQKLKRLHLSPIISFLFKVSRPLIEKNLRSKNPIIRVLDFYKLGILAQL